MPLIQRPDVALKLRERYGLISLPDLILAPELVSVTIVDDLTDLGVARRCAGRVLLSGVAGEVAQVMIGQPEPQTSDITILLRKMYIRSGGNVSVSRGVITQSAYPWITTATKQFLDLKTPGRPSAQLGYASSPVPVGRIDFGANISPDLSTTLIDTEIMIGPDNLGVVLINDQVNNYLECSFVWDEIPPT